MRVHLSFDVEVWCNDWTRLDEVFPVQLERYIYARTKHGEYALPATLDILRRHGLTGVFFVEPLFSARFGAVHLEVVVGLIRAGNHEVQLHIHPEWVDEIEPPMIANNMVKRQHLCFYDLDEQTAIIGYGKNLLQRAGSGPITAFRAGSYAANRNSFEALRRNDIFVDSSMNVCFDISGADMQDEISRIEPFQMSGVYSYPVSVFRDGFGRLRPAQIGACSFEELRDAMTRARDLGWSDFVIVSHNFELLQPGTSEPDMTVVRRFDKLCAYLASHSRDFEVCGYGAAPVSVPAGAHDARRTVLPAVGLGSTGKRYVEQLQRRLR